MRLKGRTIKNAAKEEALGRIRNRSENAVLRTASRPAAVTCRDGSLSLTGSVQISRTVSQQKIGCQGSGNRDCGKRIVEQLDCPTPTPYYCNQAPETANQSSKCLISMWMICGGGCRRRLVVAGRPAVATMVNSGTSLQRLAQHRSHEAQKSPCITFVSQGHL